MRIARSLIPATLMLAGAFAALVPVQAQAPAAAMQPAQNATPPAVPIAPPGGAPRSFADLTARLAPAVVNVSTTQKVAVGKLRGIHPEVLATRQILDVPDYGAAPVDDGAEDIEDEGFD